VAGGVLVATGRDVGVTIHVLEGGEPPGRDRPPGHQTLEWDPEAGPVAVALAR
jgi:hypothetical protein